VWNSLLQIMDDGRLTDGQGRQVDFRNTVVIMTSNVGAEVVKRGPLGFVPRRPSTRANTRRASTPTQLKRLFRPEFLNRIDEIIVFETLTKEQIRRIVQLLMHDISVRMDELGFTVEMTDAKPPTTSPSVGYDPNYGARPLRRLLQRQVENELSKRLLKGDVQNRRPRRRRLRSRRRPRRQPSSTFTWSSRRRLPWSCRSTPSPHKFHTEMHEGLRASPPAVAPRRMRATAGQSGHRPASFKPPSLRIS
jgi:ATP-dependent Clp protease ATP-binding subunit ClpA